MPPTNPEQEREKAVREKDEKVAAVISHLKEDCDSNLFQLARHKADSIRQVRKRASKK